jgi:hypothetical protein
MFAVLPTFKRGNFSCNCNNVYTSRYNPSGVGQDPNLFHSTCWLQSAYFQMQKNTEPDKIQMSMHQTDVNIHNKTLKEIAGTPVRMLKLCKLLFRTFRQ